MFRAYKGQAANLVSNTQVLVDALTIHAVEAEHASEVRRLRGQKRWITDATTDISFAAATYAGEGEYHPRDQIVSRRSPRMGSYPASAATEAFDEPLTMARVLWPSCSRLLLRLANIWGRPVFRLFGRRGGSIVCSASRPQLLGTVIL